MNKIKKYEVKTYYVVQECECGGDIDGEYEDVMFVYPKQRDYKCNKCGKTRRLIEPNFPHTEIEKI